jgi:hypothetical protein
MTIQELEKKINEIAANKQIHEQEVINNILAHLEVTYSPKIYSNEDNELIEEIKNKIGTVLYSCDRQKMGVNQMTKYNEVFGLDQVEMKLLDNAWTELEAQGYIYSLMYEIGLTEEGIRKFR